VLRDLRGLTKETAEFVGRHLVAATALADEDPELAWEHARAARAKGGRIAVVRETAGLVAYRAGEWAEAVAELRAARRMGGGPGHVAILADCERALGNPERALEMSRSPEAAELDPEAAAELRIVAAGARADLGQLEAALLVLDPASVPPGLDDHILARIAYAYADLLDRADRRSEAVEWFARAADLDEDNDTDAADRLHDLMEGAEAAAPVEAAEKLSTSAPTEPSPTEPAPTDPAATEPAPTGPGPNEPAAAAEPAATEPAEEPAPTEPAEEPEPPAVPGWLGIFKEPAPGDSTGQSGQPSGTRTASGQDG
jgi:tetratricopeptide (TPR) repeat protein